MTINLNSFLRTTFLLLLIITFAFPAMAQEEREGLPGLPPIGGGGITLMDQTSFLVVMGAAVASYGLAEFVCRDTNLNFYQARLGFIQGQGNTSVIIENFGIEKRVAPWFAIAIELNNQQWFNQEARGMGVGLNTYYRWYAFGKKRVSPFIEYGAGLYHGFNAFPTDGTRFTFNLTTALGVEYTLNNQNKLRVSYGHLHQSNNDLLPTNPGFDGNGFSISYSQFWGMSRW